MDGMRIERQDEGVVVVTLDRPDRRNALHDPLLLDHLPAAFSELGQDLDVRAIVLTGAPGAFSSGADLDCGGLEQPTPVDSQAYMERSHSTLLRIREARQPVIASIDGPAVGAGLGLAAACDVRIASPSSRFIAPFLKMGLPPDFGTTHLLPRLVGPDVALDLFLSSRAVEGEEALRIGLVTRLSDDPLADALELAASVAAAPTYAVSQTKRNVYSGLESDLRTAVFDSEIRAVAAALHSDGFRRSFAGWKQQITGR